MTDGIIQNEFIKLDNYMFENCKDIGECRDALRFTLKELIQKIKQYLESSDATTIGRIQTLKQLIGDNKE